MNTNNLAERCATFHQTLGAYMGRPNSAADDECRMKLEIEAIDLFNACRQVPEDDSFCATPLFYQTQIRCLDIMRAMAPHIDLRPFMPRRTEALPRKSNGTVHREPVQKRSTETILS